MANTLTPNLGLKKPSGDMNVSRADLNDNWDALDAADLTHKGTYIPDNADLNDYTTPGKYYCTNAARAATLSHCPIANTGFSLDVLVQAAGTSGAGEPLVVQIITPTNTNPAGIMPYYRLGSSWTDWYQFISKQQTTNKLTVTGTTSANGNLRFSLPKKGIVTAAWTASNSHMLTVFPDNGADADGSTKWYIHAVVSTSGATVANTELTVYVLYVLP